MDFNPEQYVPQAAALLGVSIPDAQLPTVIEHFERVQAIARPVLEFSLPDDLEAAAQFEP